MEAQNDSDMERAAIGSPEHIPTSGTHTPDSTPQRASTHVRVRYVTEDVKEGHKIARAMDMAIDTKKIFVVPTLHAFVEKHARVSQFPLRFLIPIIVPLILSAMPKLRSGAWFKRGSGFTIASNSSGLLLADTGENKSGALMKICKWLTAAMKMRGVDYHATDFTIEALFAQMARNAGTVLVTMDEAKKLVYLDQYKGAAGGDSLQRIMEAQDGNPSKTLRAAAFAQEDSENDEEDEDGHKQKKLKQTVIPHFNLAGAGHPQMFARNIAKEQKDDPVGGAIRMSVLVCPGERMDLGEREDLENAAVELDALPSMAVVLNLMHCFGEMLYQQSNTKETFYFLLCDNDAYKVEQRHVREMNDLKDELRGALAAGCPNKLQTGCYSKQAGYALRYGGMWWTFNTMWNLTLETDSLRDFSEHGNYEDLVEVAQPLLQGLVTSVLDKGGKVIDAVSMEAGVYLSKVFMNQQLLLMNQTQRRMVTLAETSAEASTNDQGPRPTPSEFKENDKKYDDTLALHDFSHEAVFAAALIVWSPKTKEGIASASFLNMDSSKLPIGDPASGEPKKSFAAGAHVLNELGLGEIITETIPESRSDVGAAGKKRYFFKCVDIEKAIRDGAIPNMVHDLYSEKLRVIKSTVAKYNCAFKTIIDFESWRKRTEPKKLMRFYMLDEIVLPVAAADADFVADEDDAGQEQHGETAAGASEADLPLAEALAAASAADPSFYADLGNIVPDADILLDGMAMEASVNGAGL